MIRTIAVQVESYDGTDAKSELEQGGVRMKWLCVALLFVSGAAVADVYVAIPTDTSKALYFPNIDTVQCYSVVVDSQPKMIRTDRCWQILLPTIFVKGSLLMMNRPLEQLLHSCATLGCELRAMPDN